MLKFRMDVDRIRRLPDKTEPSIIDLQAYCKNTNPRYNFPIYAGIGPLGKSQPSLFIYTKQKEAYQTENKDKQVLQRTRNGGLLLTNYVNCRPSPSKMVPKSLYVNKVNKTQIIQDSSYVKPDTTYSSTIFGETSAGLSVPKTRYTHRYSRNEENCTTYGSPYQQKKTETPYSTQMLWTPSPEKNKTKYSKEMHDFFLSYVHDTNSLKRRKLMESRRQSAYKCGGNCTKNFEISPIKTHKIHQHRKYSEKPAKDLEDTKTESKLFLSNTPQDLDLLVTCIKEQVKIPTDKKNIDESNKRRVIIDSKGIIFKGEIVDGKKQGLGLSIYQDGRAYKGQWKEDVPNGAGLYKTNFGFVVSGQFDSDLNIVSTEATFYYCNGEEYTGGVHNFIRAGMGTHKYITGDKYEGEWQEDKRQGIGKLVLKEGGRYEGSFINDAATGKGKYIDKYGNLFSAEDNCQGSFKNGELFGDAKAILCNGDEYNGKFTGGHMSGKGKIFYKSMLTESQVSETAEYEGCWTNSLRDGEGVMKWSDGTVFEGKWKSDKRCFGKLKSSRGYNHEGYWQNDFFNGPGKLIMRNGDLLECIFKEGKAITKGKMFYKNGDKYTGSLVENQRQGKGHLSEKNKNEYEGFFEYDKKNGQGVLFYSNGDIYLGEFSSDKRQGNGQFYDAKAQTLYEGEFDNNQKKGKGTLYTENGRITQGIWKNDNTFIAYD